MEPEVQHAPVGRQSWLSALLGGITSRLLENPRLVLIVAAVLAVGAAALAATQMGFRGSRLDLLDPNSGYNRRWLAYLDAFGREDDIVIVVEGPDRPVVVAALDDIAARLLSKPERFHSILHQRDLSSLRRKALYFVPEEDLAEIESFSQLSRQLLDPRALSVGGVARSVERARTSAESGFADREWLRDYASGLEAALKGRSRPTSPWSQRLSEITAFQARFEPQYLLHDDDRLGLIALRLMAGDAAASVAHLRELLAVIQERHPGTTVGFTGMPVLEADEMRASQEDTASASLVSLIGVGIVFVVGFGGLRRPSFALAALLVGLAWTMAHITLAVGHLNILSASFGVILIGLGVDFSIHYLSQYASTCRDASTQKDALVATARSVGPGIVTGGVTTSLAFSTAALTPFLGVAELGAIVAGGILLCLAATMFVLPALIGVWDRPAKLLFQPSEVSHWFAPLQNRPLTTLFVGLIALVLVGGGSRELEFDHNLLNLQPANLESVVLERRLSTRLNRGVWHALSMSSDRQTLLQRKAHFEALSSVAGTEEILSSVPVASVMRRLQVERIAEQLARLPAELPSIPIDSREEVVGVAQRLAQMVGDRREVPDNSWAEVAQLDDPTFYGRVSDYQQELATELWSTLATLRDMAGLEPPSLEDLPAELRSRFVGQDGQHLLRVYGHGDIWDIEPLEEFVIGLESVDPRVTGHPVQTYYASREMLRSFLNAAIYAVLAVSIVLMLDFRQIHLCLLAMFPTACGMLLMFGALGWAGIPLNPANMIVLPLILGIGIDDGVHVVHDYLRQPRRSYRLSNATARAVLLTSATTMIGFGSMMLASHRGLRSLGQVLTIGIFCCLLTSLFLLPPLLRWIGCTFSRSE